MKRSLFLLGLSSFSVVVFADEFATTDSGKRILVKDDGTWENVEKNQGGSSNQSIIKGDGYEAVTILKGTFDMGCTKGDSECRDNEKPAHTIISINNDFYIMKSEVTQGLYEKVMGTNPSNFKDCGSDCPVESVSWYDAVKFANALSKKEGLEQCYSISGENVTWSKGVNCTGWRLPTEAEWEYAARGGESYKYAGSNNVDEVAWYGFYSDPKGTSKQETTHPVCGKKTNGYGLCDMSGNVYEWVWDWYDWEEYSTSVGDPTGPSTGSFRVYRGGSWSSVASSARVSYRFRNDPSYRGNYQGFRFTRTIR